MSSSSMMCKKHYLFFFWQFAMIASNFFKTYFSRAAVLFTASPKKNVSDHTYLVLFLCFFYEMSLGCSRPSQTAFCITLPWHITIPLRMEQAENNDFWIKSPNITSTISILVCHLKSKDIIFGLISFLGGRWYVKKPRCPKGRRQQLCRHRLLY